MDNDTLPSADKESSNSNTSLGAATPIICIGEATNEIFDKTLNKQHKVTQKGPIRVRDDIFVSNIHGPSLKSKPESLTGSIDTGPESTVKDNNTGTNQKYLDSLIKRIKSRRRTIATLQKRIANDQAELIRINIDRTNSDSYTTMEHPIIVEDGNTSKAENISTGMAIPVCNSNPKHYERHPYTVCRICNVALYNNKDMWNHYWGKKHCERLRKKRTLVDPLARENTRNNLFCNLKQIDLEQTLNTHS